MVVVVVCVCWGKGGLIIVTKPIREPANNDVHQMAFILPTIWPKILASTQCMQVTFEALRGVDHSETIQVKLTVHPPV